VTSDKLLGNSRTDDPRSNLGESGIPGYRIAIAERREAGVGSTDLVNGYVL